MNEDKKSILNLVLSFLLGVSITLAVTIPIYISSSRRANIKAGELSVRLSETERRLSEAAITIADCRKSTERITDTIQKGDGTLTGIINSLRQIRDEVQILEKRLYNYDHSSGDNDGNDSVSVQPSK